MEVCPADRPRCIRYNCSWGDRVRFSLVQVCGVSADAAIRSNSLHNITCSDMTPIPASMTSTTSSSTTTPVPTTTSIPPALTYAGDFQLLFTATLAYGSPEDFSSGARVLYAKGVVAAVGGMDPATEYGRVALLVTGSAGRRLLSGTVSVPTTVSLDSAAQLESAASSLNEDSLRAALSGYNIGLTSMSAVQTRGGRNGTTTTPVSSPSPSPSPSPNPTSDSSPGLSVAVIGVIAGVCGFFFLIILCICVNARRLTRPMQAARFAWVKIDKVLA